MPIIDLADPAGLERAYPLEAFERDAALNARTAVTEVHGVRIEAAEGPGRFEVVAATRNVGESSPDEDRLFLAPHRANESTMVTEAHPGYGGQQAVAAPEPASARRDYEGFLARLAEAMATARFQPPVGLHDDRLKGLRGG